LAYNCNFNVKNTNIKELDWYYGKSKETLPSGTNMASYPPMPQKRISAQAGDGQAELGAMVI